MSPHLAEDVVQVAERRFAQQLLGQRRLPDHFAQRVLGLLQDLGVHGSGSNCDGGPRRTECSSTRTDPALRLNPLRLLRAWINERGERRQSVAVLPDNGAKPASDSLLQLVPVVALVLVVLEVQVATASFRRRAHGRRRGCKCVGCVAVTDRKNA